MDSYPPSAQRLVDAMMQAADAAPDAAVAFQGAPGCNGHAAVRQLFPSGAPLPCYTFEDALEAVRSGRAARAVIPIENALHGRVADIHFLLPESGLSIVDEFFLPIRHALLGCGGIDTLVEVISHPQALGQCRRTLQQRRLRAIAFVDTAAAAAEVASLGTHTVAALAPPIAAQLYGLDVLAPDLSDAPDNVTRFVTLEREPKPAVGPGPWLTTLLFAVRSVPAALYKALGGFATNGVNLSKLESYQAPGRFTASEFYCDIEGTPEDPPCREALRDLAHHCEWVRIIGTYPSRRARG